MNPAQIRLEAALKKDESIIKRDRSGEIHGGRKIPKWKKVAILL
jgi:hypothetical protein